MIKGRNKTSLGKRIIDKHKAKKKKVIQWYEINEHILTSYKRSKALLQFLNIQDNEIKSI